jgi:hypothetical protein
VTLPVTIGTEIWTSTIGAPRPGIARSQQQKAYHASEHRFALHRARDDGGWKCSGPYTMIPLRSKPESGPLYNLARRAERSISAPLKQRHSRQEHCLQSSQIEWRLPSPSVPCAAQAPSSWRGSTAPLRISALPSDSQAQVPTSRDILPVTYCSGCASAASVT